MTNEKPALFKGIGAFLPTPFEQDGRVDYFSFYKLLKNLRRHPPEALLVLSPFGEEAALSFKEWKNIAKDALSFSSVSKVLVGCFGASSGEILKKAEYASDLGAEGLFVGLPYGVVPSQKGVFAHYSALASKNLSPMILAEAFPFPLLLELSRLPSVYGALLHRQTLLEEEEARLCSPLPLYTLGEESFLFCKNRGFSGAFSPYYTLFAKELENFFKKSNTVQRLLLQALLPFLSVAKEESSPALLKELLSKQGEMNPLIRLPLVENASFFVNQAEKAAASFQKSAELL